MRDGSDNPFRKLAQAFADNAADGKKKQHSLSGLSSKTAASSRPSERMDDDEDENALFLSTVSRIKPVASKGRGSSGKGKSLGQALRERMRENARSTPDTGDNFSSQAFPPSASDASGQQKPLGRDDDSQGRAIMEKLLKGRKDEPLMDEKESAAFAKAMQGVAPVTGKGRDIAAPAPKGNGLPAPDAAKALRDVLEGKVEFALHHTDEYMEGFVVGVDPLVIARLRAGQYSPEAHIDLHGMNARQAYEALTWFIRNSYQKGLRTLVVITGRGRNSPDGIGVLRPMMQSWLCREPFKRVVLAFCTAKPHDGGPGALYVLLRKYKKSRGKIVWEHTPSDEDFPEL